MKEESAVLLMLVSFVIGALLGVAGMQSECLKNHHTVQRTIVYEFEDFTDTGVGMEDEWVVHGPKP